MPDPFIGQIMMFGGNFAPRGWALCDGQLLPISSHESLFSILGTTFGGDGRTTFGLPDLRGRVPVHAGNGPGLSNYNLGEKSGRETNTLTVNQLPAHRHEVKATTQVANTGSPANSHLAQFANNAYATNAVDDVTMDEDTIGYTGEGQPVDNVQPFLTINFIIALEGVYPSRN